MTTIASMPVARRAAPRQALVLAAVGYTALIVYGSLYPFSGWVANPDPFAFLFGVARRAKASYGDLVTNVVAYVPLGFLAARALRTRMQTAVAVPLAMIATALLSLAMEVLQGYLPVRVQSIYDLAANAAGGVAGAMAAHLIHSPGIASDVLRRLRDEWLVKGRLAGVGAFAVLAWALARLMPFVPSLDVGKFRQALAPIARIIEFPGAFSGWRMLAEALSYAGFGVIVFSLVRPNRSGLAAFGLIVGGLLVAQIVMVRQVLLPEVAVGAAVGMAAAWGLSRLHTVTRSHAAFFLLYAGFCIAESVSAGSGDLRAFNWIPFVGQLDNTVNGIASLLDTTGLAAALAWATLAGAEGSRPSVARVAATGLFVFCSVLALELQQRFIPGRVGDLTTPLVVGLTWVVAWYVARHAGTTSPAAPAAAIPVAEVPAGRTAPAVSGPGAVGASALRSPLLALLAVAGVIYAVTRMPIVPYNVRELLYWGHPARSALLLAIALFLTLGVPAWCLAKIVRRPNAMWLLPVLLALDAAIAYEVVVNAVPSRSLHDIVGFPVWTASREIETALRFVALHGAVTLLVAGGAALAAALLRRDSAGLLWRYAIIAAAFAPVLHWAIVTEAATDNLVELMRNGGSPTATMTLSLAAIGAFGAASLVAGSLAFRRRRRIAIVVAMAAAFVVYGLVVAGTEDALFKYGKVFSALQFMLSPDRAHYVSQSELIARYAVAYLLLACAVVLFQYGAWRSIAPARADLGTRPAYPAPMAALAETDR